MFYDPQCVLSKCQFIEYDIRKHQLEGTPVHLYSGKNYSKQHQTREFNLFGFLYL
jgi:hypothetical protein